MAAEQQDSFDIAMLLQLLPDQRGCRSRLGETGWQGVIQNDSARAQRPARRRSRPVRCYARARAPRSRRAALEAGGPGEPERVRRRARPGPGGVRARGRLDLYGDGHPRAHVVDPGGHFDDVRCARLNGRHDAGGFGAGTAGAEVATDTSTVFGRGSLSFPVVSSTVGSRWRR